MLSGFSPDAGGDTPASRDERIPGLSVFIYGKRVNNHMETGLPGHFDVTGGPVSLCGGKVDMNIFLCIDSKIIICYYICN